MWRGFYTASCVAFFGGPPHSNQVNVFKPTMTSPNKVINKKMLWAGLFAVALTTGLAGCGSVPEDEFSGQTADKLYADARDEAAEGNYEAAIKRYEKVEARASGTVMAQQAQLELAYAYYKTGERAQALAKIERFVRLHPTSPAMDYALYLQGLINFNDDLGLFSFISKQDLSERDQQASRDAYESFKQLLERYPNSRYAGDARLRLNHIVNTLAAGEVHVARFYYERGAYLAAINRAQYAVSEFRNSPAVEEALYIMVRAYDQLAMPQLRDDALRVLKTSFPESGYIREGYTPAAKPWWQLW
jgi:outer membrane protein assembly factor BamD